VKGERGSGWGRDSQLLASADQKTRVGSVDRNQFAMFISGRAETVACPSDDMLVLVTDERLKRAFVPRCDRADDPALAVPNELFPQ